MYYPEKNIKYDLNPEIWGIEDNLLRAARENDEDFSIGKYASIGRQDDLGNAPLMGAYPLENSQISFGTTGQGNASQGTAQGTQGPGAGTSGFSPFIVGQEPNEGMNQFNMQEPLTSMGTPFLGFEPMMPMYPPMPNMGPQAQWSNQGMGFPPYNPYMQQGIGPMQQGMGPMQPEQWNMPFMGGYPPYLASNLGQTNLPMMPAVPIEQGPEIPMPYQMFPQNPIGYWCIPMANPYMMNQGMFPGSPFMTPMMPGTEMMPTDQEPVTEEGLESQELTRGKKHKKKKKQSNKYNYYNCGVYGSPHKMKEIQHQHQHHLGPCGCHHPSPFMWMHPFMKDMKEEDCCHSHHHHY